MLKFSLTVSDDSAYQGLGWKGVRKRAEGGRVQLDRHYEAPCFISITLFFLIVSISRICSIQILNFLFLLVYNLTVSKFLLTAKFISKCDGYRISS